MLYSKVAEGTFPRPISLGARAVGWVDTEVDAWVSGRIEQSRKAPDGRLKVRVSL